MLPPQANGVCAELEYAVQRLVKGLASNRKRARHGFYTALTQVMNLPAISVAAPVERFTSSSVESVLFLWVL